MATPDFVLELRRHVGHAPLWMPGTTAVVLRRAEGSPAPGWSSARLDPREVEVLCVRRADNGAWTPVTGIVDPGEEPAVAAQFEDEVGCCHWEPWSPAPPACSPWRSSAR